MNLIGTAKAPMLKDPSRPLNVWESDLIRRMEEDYAGVVRDLGGIPFALICPPGRLKRYQRMADYLHLKIFENGAQCKQMDRCVLIHAGEVAKWLPGYRVAA